VQEAARRHEAVFGSYAMLRYTLAESHLEAGDPQQAEDLARKVLARGQSGPNRPPSVVERERTAQQLWVRSRHAWAQAELEAALAQSDLIQRSAWESAGLLSRLHEDAERYKEAASVWEPFADRLVHEPGYRAQIDETFKDHEEGMTQSRMCLAHYYYLQAMARRESDAPQAYEYLCKALEMDDKEIDATIALYRLRDNAFAQSKAQEAIARIQKSLRAKIGEATDQSNQRNDLFATMLYWQQTALNNLAWLQINTGGDAREALSMAERACSLSPDTASYLDTLARCHFVLGDAPQAISFQKMAIDLEPYSLALKRPLLEYETSFESPPLSPNQ
jgi:tetratricopeptide (TPR) repeat protein